MDNFDFKKKWGQNFLRNTATIMDAISSLQLDMNDRILEIGPGNGLITEFLIPNCEFVKALEIDPELIALLNSKFQQYIPEEFEIVAQNVLDSDPQKILVNDQINKVIGALPYNISKKIIELFCTDQAYLFERFVFILQKEVAHSYAATKKGSFIHHYLNIYNKIYLIRDIERSQFVPEPKVDSSLIVFVPREKTLVPPKHIPDFKKFLTNAFRNPRKKLIKNLKNIYKDVDWHAIFADLGIDENTRVEELKTDILIELYPQV